MFFFIIIILLLLLSYQHDKSLLRLTRRSVIFIFHQTKICAGTSMIEELKSPLTAAQPFQRLVRMSS